MRNVKLTIAYDGARCCGWQTQRTSHASRKPSVQATIESVLKKLLREPIILVASGRTDSGVHALAQVANFKTRTAKPCREIQFALNSHLPKDIRILNVVEVPLDFHARFNARSKVYRYYVCLQSHPPPFLHEYCYRYRLPVKRVLMQKAAKVLVGRHDFKVFCASGSTAKTTIRTIHRLQIKQQTLFSTRLLIFEIEGDGFLYNMVRNIVGTLLDVGRGRFLVEDVGMMLARRKRQLAGPCVPAKGLFLVQVNY